MEPKPRSTSVKKADKGNPATSGDKKEGTIKDQPIPTAKKATTGDTAPVNHEDSKPTVPEPQAPPSVPENKADGEENDSSNGAADGSGFEGLKPLLMAAGVAVAAIAVIVGVVFLARKK
ncbi:cell cycle exit and neuronal differentiation protein 1 [Rana temporaria]|uniref:cell cycle exit and neuronal differentiation protein 1 n=1 Tax=Rana temporaria TaxID=8407 RepID=UPI001AADC1EF|nr:cell cycle exit and neuronal differentiation protein 1 [Rana temporaria]